MPLVVLTGLPSSGKSSRALEIQQYLSARHPGLSYRLVSEETLLLKRKDAYKGAPLNRPQRSALLTPKDSRMEKDTRGLIKSEVERFTGTNSLVIVDSVNYIKGFRYELFCIAKNSRTTHCVVFVDTPFSMCEEFRVAAESVDPSGVYFRHNCD